MLFGLEVEDRASDRAIEKAILEVVTATPGLNKTALIGAVGARVMRIGQNRVSGVIGRLEQQRKLAVRTGERGAKLYDLRHKPGGGTPAA